MTSTMLCIDESTPNFASEPEQQREAQTADLFITLSESLTMNRTRVII